MITNSDAALGLSLSQRIDEERPRGRGGLPTGENHGCVNASAIATCMSGRLPRIPAKPNRGVFAGVDDTIGAAGVCLPP
jgi:hypothetical protein